MFFLTNILVVFFIVVGVISLILAYIPIATNKKRNGTKTFDIEESINKNLLILKEDNTAEKKAIAFVVLIDLAYVLVHTIINQGNNYNDKMQTKSFCESLTPQLLKKLNSME